MLGEAFALVKLLNPPACARPENLELMLYYLNHASAQKLACTSPQKVSTSLLFDKVESSKQVQGKMSNGCGSKFNRRGYAGFGPCVHLPGFHFGTGSLSHSQIVDLWSQTVDERGSLSTGFSGIAG